MRTLEKRIKRFAKRSSVEGECIVYTGQRGPYVFLRNEYGIMEGLHRMSYRYFKGDPDEVVRHSCDNPRCRNPAHLLTGTHLDNVRDKVERNRDYHTLGEDHSNAVLSDALARSIVYEYISNKGVVTQQELATKYGVSQALISQWVLGRTRARRLSSSM